MDLLNTDTEVDGKITSRYTIVIAASKRARQIIAGSPCDRTGVATDKAVSIAVNEMRSGKINIIPQLSDEEIRSPEPKVLSVSAIGGGLFIDDDIDKEIELDTEPVDEEVYEDIDIIEPDSIVVSDELGETKVDDYDEDVDYIEDVYKDYDEDEDEEV
jgi:DNA-directed RNA polymerase subunit omega